MDEQFNSDSTVMKSVRTSTFWDGKLLSQAIQNRKPVYGDHTGSLWLVPYNGIVIMESDPRGPFVISTFRRWKQIQKTLEDNLRDRGLTHYFALVDSDVKYRWCRFLGFRSAELMLTDTIELMVKEI